MHDEERDYLVIVRAKVRASSIDEAERIASERYGANARYGAGADDVKLRVLEWKTGYPYSRVGKV